MTTVVHLIGGLAGCRFGAAEGGAVIVVDALRASATAAALCDEGAAEILCVGTLDAARAAKSVRPGALLYGERGAVPPEGFDYGNSPQLAHHAAGRSVVFTTTNGTACLLAAWGAHSIFFGTTMNAAAVVRALEGFPGPIVVVPAGKVADPEMQSPEDWAAAVVIAERLGGGTGEGASAYRRWQERIAEDGLIEIFRDCAHAQVLRDTGQEADIDYCAQVDVLHSVPAAIGRIDEGVLVAPLQRDAL